MFRVIASIATIVLAPLFAASADDVDFVRDIRPILSENCSFCHGPDSATREADLRLDTPEGIATVIDQSGSEQSELFRRVVSDDPDELMPPRDSNRKLTPGQIELLERWIDQGAEWDQHWSFLPLVAPPEPTVPGDHSSIRNPIDSFVQSLLVEKDMRPASEASRATLIRRLSLDLTGLPPTPEQLQRFLDDKDDDAYERLVERTLRSPAYGQRMAWDWLDAARYADTNGYQGDRERTMWPWRDWVVRSFNENMPFDQFTVWQLAGDLLPDATAEQVLATGFCRNHMINGEGGRIAEENRVEYVMDMSETMGTVWLGLTLNCCRCHDHKYDPITNQEYYQFFSFFNQTPVKGNGGDPQMAPVLAVADKGQAEQRASIAAQMEAIDKEMVGLSKRLVSEQLDWETTELKRLTDSTAWRRLRPSKVFASGAALRTLDDDSVLAGGKNPDHDTYTFRASTDLPRVTAIRIEALRHPTMTKGGVARSDSGNFVLTGLEVSRTTEDGPPSALSIASAQATFEQGGHLVHNVFDSNPKSGWAVYQGRPIDRDHVAIFVLKEPVEVRADDVFQFVLRHDSVHKKHNLGRFRISVTDAAAPKLSPPIDELAAALRIAPQDRDDDQKRVVSRSHRKANAQYQTLQKKRDALVKRRGDLEKRLPKVMVMEDMKSARQTFVLERGLYNKPTAEVFPSLPKFLPVSDSQGSNEDRLTLARWLVSDEHPLTARVTVNRFWQQFFGIGLVKTSEDFGSQGEIPVQMDLLNWLAADFRDNGWDVKQLVRQIVTSHTYRQSSKVTDPSAREQDPENRLLARGARYRMPAWMLRDQALAISGLLSDVGEGPAVNTYQPPGVWEEASFGKKTYQQDTGEKLYRRSLYTFWRRIISPTMFFDNATRQTCTVRPGRTNTPLHALQTLNNVAYVEAARALAELAIRSDADSDRNRLKFVFRRALARAPSDTEADILLNGLDRTRQAFKHQPQEAAKFTAVGESARDETIEPVEHASWMALCSAVLNLDETLTRE